MSVAPGKLWNLTSFRILPNIHEEVKSKNPTIRIHNAEYLYLILTIFPEESLSNYLGTIDDLLTNLIQDAKSEARQLARMAYFRYKQFQPDRASSIFMHLDA